MDVGSVQRAKPDGTSGEGATGSYVVRPGDTLSSIAARHGLSLAALERANPQIGDFDLIRPGQHIHMSLHGSRNAAADGSAGLVARASAEGQAGLPVSGPHASVAAVAEHYLGQNASDLEQNQQDKLPMRDGVDPTVCCANFVSAVLVQSGQIKPNEQTTLVSQLKRELLSDGWKPVSAANARPGDVVIIQGTYHGHHVSHTELISGPGQMIGSNNRNSDGTQRITHSGLGWALQTGATTLRAPTGVRGEETTAARASQQADAASAVPSGDGSLTMRQAEAVHFFGGKGWSHVQASGIVANLTRESQLSTDARGDGGLAYGLGQWHPDRQAEFEHAYGHSIRGSSFGEQLAFVEHELRTTESGAGQRLGRATSAGDAAAVVSRYYERPADVSGEAAARGRIATQIAAGT